MPPKTSVVRPIGSLGQCNDGPIPCDQAVTGQLTSRNRDCPRAWPHQGSPLTLDPEVRDPEATAGSRKGPAGYNSGE